MWRIRFAGIAGLLLLFLPFAHGQVRNLTVASAASFDPGLPNPGSLAAAFCDGLTGIDAPIVASQMPLPFELAGVHVAVGGIAAPILAVAKVTNGYQVNFQVPWEAIFVANADVKVEQNGSFATTKVVWLSSIGQFFRSQGDTGAFQRAQDFSLITPSNPARPGSAISGYLTGLTDTTPHVPTGQPAPFDPLAVLPQKEGGFYPDQFYRVAITSGPGDPTLVPTLFLGLTPGLVGVYQVNFVLPPGTDVSHSTVGIQLVRFACLLDVSIPFRGGCYVGNAQQFPSKTVQLPVAVN